MPRRGATVQRDTLLDADFQTGVYNWSTICAPVTTAAITTPVVSPIIVSADPKFCAITLFSACQSASVSLDECDSSYSGQNFFSCACEPAMLSLHYTCEFLGNISCFHSPAALTNMPDYTFCTDLVSVLGPLAANQTVS
jgi:hypothetical protein